MSIQCSRGSRSFAKETRALKMRSVVGDHWKLTTTNWEQSLKLSLLQLHEKPPMNSALTILLSLGIWGKLERWKSSISECLLRWLEKKPNHRFEVLSSRILHNNNEPFLYQIVTRDKKWIWYDSWWQPAQWVAWEEAPKHFPKPNLHQKMVMVTGGLLPGWSTTVFWIPVKPLHLRSMLSKWMICTENSNVCSQHWSTEGPDSSPWQCPNAYRTTFQKLNELGYEILPHPPYTSHLLTTTSSRIS